jgi:1-acyl-sn-glycerol-3-phosphate acyltransferase
VNGQADRVGRIFWLTHGLVYRILRHLYGLEVVGWQNIPGSGPAIVACNHVATLDPPVVGASVPHRPVRFMAKKELFSTRLTDWLLRQWGAFPVDRARADRRALSFALQLLSEGSVVGIFPEGTRSRTGTLGEGHTGVALLAARTGAPVVPGAVFHTLDMERRRFVPGGPPLRVVFGPPIAFPGEEKAARARLEEIRDEIMEAIARVIQDQRAARP